MENVMESGKWNEIHTVNIRFRFSFFDNGIGRAHLFNGILIVANDNILMSLNKNGKKDKQLMANFFVFLFTAL